MESGRVLVEVGIVVGNRDGLLATANLAFHRTHWIVFSKIDKEAIPEVGPVDIEGVWVVSLPMSWLWKGRRMAH